ncbi:hypothetical protein EXIGLDRAFT_729083 [Exidia glandulosa HHB12029]|uniref:Extracellular membrane protein CFEM domain-containing protein n=1 Tax=Exidia glandulosa HHB12029 TaxID=1314781 RepID=A0A165ZID2_EXIGL|nr:hypothetical protein EXIGLDRAFT_729083 [Exidia glandulosa HHB12029]
MRFSVLLVAVVTTFASVQASWSLFGRPMDATACASSCGSQSVSNNPDAAAKCRTDSCGDSTKFQICFCSSPSLFQSVNDCMQKKCPNHAHLFQTGCDTIIAVAKTSSTPPSTPEASCTCCRGLVGFAGGVLFSSVMFVAGLIASSKLILMFQP